MFVNIDCRWPGFLHGSIVFAISKFNTKMIDNQLPVTYRNLLPSNCEVPCYVIDDPAYPVTPYCMKEHANCQNNSRLVLTACYIQLEIRLRVLLTALRRGGQYCQGLDGLENRKPTHSNICLFHTSQLFEREEITFNEEEVRKYINENDNYLAIVDPVYS